MNKISGHLRVDRPQRYSSQPPTLYGFVPQTYCGNRVGQRCSERTGTPLFRARLPADRIAQITQHLAEGTGARPTSRLCHVRLNTVLRYSARVGGHAQAFHDEVVHHVTVSQAQADEAWSFVGKKRRAR